MSIFPSRFLRRACCAAVVAALGPLVALSGCGSSVSTKTTATTAAGSTSTSSGGGGASGGGGGGQSDQLSSFATSVKLGENATFKAVYSYSGAGNPGTITIEQKLPKTLFKSAAGEVIGTGTATYFCSTSSGPPTCYGGASGSTNPLASVSQLFSSQSVVSVLQAAQAQIAAKAQGYDVSFSTQRFAGVDANCVTVTANALGGKYCVTKDGILVYGGTTGQIFQLTSFSANVSDRDFSLPPGATTVTFPAAP